VTDERLSMLARLKMYVSCLRRERSLGCSGEKRYGCCDEGCAELRKLREGVKCVDRSIYVLRGYHEGL
jgi:hypothetical protein